MEYLVQHLPPSRALSTAHSTGDRAFLRKVSTEDISNNKIQHTCIPSVIAHHSLTFGFSFIFFISPSQSLPAYLNVANSVRSLSKNIESGSISLRPLSDKHSWQWSTISNIAVLDLLEDFGPDGCMVFLVRFDGGGLEVDDLGDAARHFVCFSFLLNWYGDEILSTSGKKITERSYS